MVDGHSLFDYNVGLNDLIQILTRKLPVPSVSDSKETNGYASSGDEGNSSDKENQKVIRVFNAIKIINLNSISELY